jgi:hypothetical protein
VSGSADIGPTPRYADATYYARLRLAGWHAVRSFGDYVIIRLECGRAINLYDGDSASTVTGKPPAGLCARCAAAMAEQPAQADMFA